LHNQISHQISFIVKRVSSQSLSATPTAFDSTHHHNGASLDFPSVNLSEALISLSHLRHNVSAVQTHIGSACRVMAVVKANAYGHTVDAVCKPLTEQGVSDFGVANINEAIQLRRIVGQGANKNGVNILAFASPLLEQLEFYAKHDVELSISSVEVFRAAEAAASKLGKPITAHLKIDTGMGRLGVQPSEAVALASLISASPHIHLKAIYTHFASSGSDKQFTKRQLKNYLSLVSEFEHQAGVRVIRHAANSGAILTDKTTHLDMVRPGILLYGDAPDTSFRSTLDLKPVMQLQSHVIFTKWVEKGASVSYGRKWIAPRRTRVATVSIGYADGYHRAFTNRASVMIHGKLFRQIGAVTMDQIMVNLGSDESVSVGDRVVLFGWEKNMSANRLAKEIGTIGYELLCAVSPRVRRVVVDE
jgi:alanine racemase